MSGLSVVGLTGTVADFSRFHVADWFVDELPSERFCNCPRHQLGEISGENKFGDEIFHSEKLGCMWRIAKQQTAVLQDGASSASLGTANHLVFPTDDVLGRRTCKAQCRLARVIHNSSEPQPGNRFTSQCDQLVDEGLVDQLIEIGSGTAVGVIGRDDTGIRPLVVVDDRPTAGESLDMVESDDVRVCVESVGLLEVAQGHGGTRPCVDANGGLSAVEDRIEKPLVARHVPVAGMSGSGFDDPTGCRSGDHQASWSASSSGDHDRIGCRAAWTSLGRLTGAA